MNDNLALGTVEKINVYALACTVPEGPVSTLALMPVRNGLLIRIELDTGLFGWGEAWCNYPPKGNLAKLALFEGPIGDALLGQPIGDWTDLRPRMERQWARMIVHTGEIGPFNHGLAAIDMAAADIAARARGLPLANLLSSSTESDVQVYASSPRVDDIDSLPGRLSDAGHVGVKLKVGFDQTSDRELLERFRKADMAGLQIGVDANQNWTPQEAKKAIAALAPFDLAFVEEPIFANLAAGEWANVAQNTPTSIAAGENISSALRFAELVTDGGLRVVQPDVAKWGGVSGAMQVSQHALMHGAEVMLHYMGTGLGLAASLHVMAALGCDGKVELDANPNPLRTDLGPIDLRPRNGRLPVPVEPGIGFEPDPEALKRFGVAQTTIRANNRHVPARST